MVGSVEDVDTEKIEPLPEYYFDPTAVLNEPVVEEGNGCKRDIVVGRNVHSTCLAVTEPDTEDELTGDREAHMASVLARYRKSLLERTKHHLGNVSLLFFTYPISLFLFIPYCFSHNVYIVFLKLGLH